jgi:cytidyltransferase-like protein
LELFVTVAEKERFGQWREVIRDKSIVSAASADVFQYLSRQVPETVSPNLLTLAGLVLLVQAWYVCHSYGTHHPTMCTWLAAVFLLAFFVTNSVTNYHADRIRQHTPLSDLFKYSCDSGSTVFLALLVSYCLGSSLETQWHAVQACQLVLFLKHLSAFKRHAGIRYRLIAGPGEVLVACVVVLAVRAAVGLETIHAVYSDTGRALASNLTVATERAIQKKAISPEMADYGNAVLGKWIRAVCLMSGSELVRMLYYGLWVAALVNSSVLLPTQHNFTKFGLLVSLLMRLVPALLLRLELPSVTEMDVICDGLFMAVLTSDLVLAKMAGRELHPWVILMSLAAVLSYSVILTLVAVYFIGVFSDLCFYMNLPLLAVSRNVYCDGVYDLCHIGHKRAFQNALSLGNRLFVGVVGDEDASKYKRPPIMTHAERCAEVEACKAVTKVIPNAPCFGLTQDFLDEHQIHVVAFGEEYLDKYPNPDDDPYYGYVRKLGIAKPLPRTKLLSTTELIERIQKAKITQKLSPT